MLMRGGSVTERARRRQKCVINLLFLDLDFDLSSSMFGFVLRFGASYICLDLDLDLCLEINQ